MELIARKALSYGGHPVSVGQRFAASARDGRALVAVGRAELVSGPIADRVPELVQIALDDGAEISPRTGKPRRQYKRRDMQAET